MVDRLPHHRRVGGRSRSGSGRRFTGAAKALTYGAAAGLGYGLQAAVTKTFVTEVGWRRPRRCSRSWSVYVLILSAVTGFALQQSALKTGVLAPAMASSQLGDAVLERDPRHHGVRRDAVSKSGTAHSGSTVVGLIVAIVGIALLAGSGRAANPALRARRRPHDRSPPRWPAAPSHGSPGMVLATAGVAVDTWWQYLLLFVAVAASWAGVPFIGATALGAAGVAASQGRLNLAVVVGVATVGGRGRRPHRLRRREPLGPRAPRAPGQAPSRAAGRWSSGANGPTPAGAAWPSSSRPPIVSGTAKMQSRPVRPVEPDRLVRLRGRRSPPARTASDASSPATHSPRDIGTLLVGLAVGALVMVLVRPPPPSSQRRQARRALTRL